MRQLYLVHHHRRHQYLHCYQLSRSLCQSIRYSCQGMHLLHHLFRHHHDLYHQRLEYRHRHHRYWLMTCSAQAPVDGRDPPARAPARPPPSWVLHREDPRSLLQEAAVEAGRLAILDRRAELLDVLQMTNGMKSCREKHEYTFFSLYNCSCHWSSSSLAPKTLPG